MDSRKVVFWECCECNGVTRHTSAWDAGGHEWCLAGVTCDHVRCSYCKHLDKDIKPISYCDDKPLDTPGRSNFNTRTAPGKSETKSTGNAIPGSVGRIIETTSTTKSSNTLKKTSGKAIAQTSGTVSGKAPNSPKPSARAAPYPSSKRNSLTTTDTSHNTPGNTTDEANRWTAFSSSNSTGVSTASTSPTASDRHISDMPFQCSAQGCEKRFMSIYALEQHNLKYHYQALSNSQAADPTYFIDAVRQLSATSSQGSPLSTNTGTPGITFSIASHTVPISPATNAFETAPPKPPATLSGSALKKTRKQPTKFLQSQADSSTNSPISPSDQASPSHATFWDAVGGRRELIGTPRKSSLDDAAEANAVAKANPGTGTPET